MPFTKFTNLDFNEIKESIKDYLRANSNFTGFDFEGSNFSVLIDTLAYNTYITAFNSNMIVNESFLDSATLRENVVSLARNIGYVPRSRGASKANVTFTVNVTDTDTGSFVLKRGLVCVGDTNDSSYVFSIPDDIRVTTTENNAVDAGNNIVYRRTATFDSVEILQGTFLTKQFTFDGSLDQKFVLNNSFIDTSTIRVYVRSANQVSGLGVEYSLVDDITNIDGLSPIYLIQEVQDEKYELLFGDGYFGKKLENGDVITVNYIVTDGIDGNGVSNFSFSGRIVNGEETSTLTPDPFTVTTVNSSRNGSNIESLESIKYYAPKIYSSQSRAVTASDYEAIIKKIYPDTQSVSIVGGEELDPPEYGTVQISIKPKNGDLISDFNKTKILSEIKKYSIAGINQKIVDLKILYVELDTSVYFDSNKVTSSSELKSQVTSALTHYSNSLDLNKFGGRFRYSKVLSVIDSVNGAITSNITKVKIRRNIQVLPNQFTQYELCFGNQFHVDRGGFNIKSTGFTITGNSSLVYITDIPNSDLKSGVISIVKRGSEGTISVVAKSAGTVDYVTGEVNLSTINITSTEKSGNIIEIQAFPESNDVVGLKDLYLQLDISKTKINMLEDVIASGEEKSGVVFSRDSYTSSYSNGSLNRQ